MELRSSPSQRQWPEASRWFHRLRPALLTFLIAGWLLAAASSRASAPSSSGPLMLSESAVRRLEAFGLRELAEPPQPPAAALDQDTSRALQAHVHCLRGHFFLASNQLARAREAFEKAAEILPDHYGIQLSLADIDSRTFKSSSTLEICDRLIEQQPDRIEAYELKGRVLEANGQVAQAMLVYDEALKRWPACDFLVEQQLRLAFARGQLDRTLEICKRRLEREPRHFNTLWMLGYVYAMKAQEASEKTELYQESAKYYERALETRASATKLYPRLAETYERLGRPDKAIATLRRGLVADATDAEIRKAFERLISPQRKDDQILAAYRDLADEYPSSPAIQKLYASQLAARRQFQEARDRYARVLDLLPNSVDVLLALGDLEVQLGRGDEATKHFERAASLAPDVETFEKIGAAYLRAQRYDHATEFFEKARRRDPNRKEIYAALSQAYLETGQMDKAAQVARDGLQIIKQPKDRKLLLLALGDVQELRKEHTEALATFREAYAGDRTDMPLFFKLAGLLLTVGDDKAFDQLIADGHTTFRSARDPFDRAVIVLLLDFHRYEQAVPEIRALIERDRNARDLHILYVHLATAYQRLRQTANGERLYEEAKERLGDSPDFYRFASRFHTMRYDHQRAYEALGRLLELTPVPRTQELAGERFAVYSSLIFNLARLKKTAEIPKLLERIEQELGTLDPKEMRMIRARALAEMKHHDQAIDLFRSMIDSEPDNPSLHYELGAVLNEARQIENAEKALRRCLEMLPELPLDPADRELRATALNHLGYMFAEEGTKLEEAEQLLSRALDLEPRAGHIVDSMGWVQFKLGHIDQALRLLQTAINCSNEDPVLYDHLGDIYARAGDRQKALESWREALRLDPASETIKTKINGKTADSRSPSPNK